MKKTVSGHYCDLDLGKLVDADNFKKGLSRSASLPALCLLPEFALSCATGVTIEMKQSRVAVFVLLYTGVSTQLTASLLKALMGLEL